MTMENFSGLKLILSSLFLLFVTETSSQTSQAPSQYNIRLVGPGSTPYRGRVEVYYVNHWRTIDFTTFRQAEANVTCRQLGFQNGGTPLNSSAFGTGNGYIWGFQCNGQETLIMNCLANPHNTNASNSHSFDAGVECKTTPYNGQVRIIDDAGLRGVGFVEVYVNGSWGAVCNDKWSLNDAKVICRSLGYNTTYALAGADNKKTALLWSAVNRQFKLGGVTCNGLETNFTSCNHNNATPALCNATKQNHYASVSCVPIPNLKPSLPIPVMRCDKNISASFSKINTPTLRKEHLTIASSKCKFDKNANATHVTVSFGFFDCGTVNTSNTTHITYNNTLVYKYNYPMPGNPQLYSNLQDTYGINLMCHISRNVFASQCLDPIPQTINISATTHLQMKMGLYLDGHFQGAAATSYPLQVILKQLIGVKLILDSIDPTLKLVPHDCWATPNSNSNHTLRQPLFQQKCPTINDLSFFSFDSKSFGFNYHAFKFENYNTTCIHCAAYVCLTSENTGQCDPRCNSKRKKREAGGPCRYRREAGHQEMTITSPIIQFVEELNEKTAERNGNTITLEKHAGSYSEISKAPPYNLNIWYSVAFIISTLFVL